MAFSLIPKEIKFFDLFDKQAEKMIQSAKLLSRLVNENDFTESGLREMAVIEHECDDLTHEIIDKLNRTFITPFDREDIHAIAQEMDDVVDLIYVITKRMNLYKLKANSDLLQFAKLIEESVLNVADAIKCMRNTKEKDSLTNFCIEINRLENAGDHLRDFLMAKLFKQTKDPIKVIKWKDIYQDAETVLDQCEDVANIIESVMVKQG
ncbi:MAG: DUF47 domain-containing protein [Spirochaetes bacterium]|nr:DUF47 domain-containing protein [Spirochaetota bacterium]HPA73533.1 DUF47 family protein [Spirochaetota bacterium]